MNKLHLFPEADGLQAALMRQSALIRRDHDRRKFDAEFPCESTAESTQNAGFVSCNYAGPGGLVVPVGANVQRLSAAQEDARQSAAPAVVSAAPAKPGSDCTTVTTWRRGCDIPEAERVGLWHIRRTDPGQTPGCAVASRHIGWGLTHAWFEYRPAAPGTKPGDDYDEARYATPQPAAAPVKPPLLWRPWSREAMASLGDALVHIIEDTSDGRVFTSFAHKASHHLSGTKQWLHYTPAATGTKEGEECNPFLYTLPDADGFFPHEPVAGAVCPVPEGVAYEVRFRDGNVDISGTACRWNWGSCNIAEAEITGWRPAQ